MKFSLSFRNLISDVDKSSEYGTRNEYCYRGTIPRAIIFIDRHQWKC